MNNIDPVLTSEIETKKFNILVVPCTEWLKGSQQRLHHLSREWSNTANVYVFYLQRQDEIKYETNPSRLEYCTLLKIPTIKVRNYALFLIANFLLELIYFPRIIRNAKIDVVVAEGLGPSNAASFVTKFLRRRFIFDYSDSYSSFVAAYISNRLAKKVLEYLALLMTKENINFSKATVVVSDGLMTSATKDCRHYKIVNGVSDENFPIIPESRKDKVIITFMGAVESWVNFEEILDAIKALNTGNNRFKLKIVGDGLKLRELKETVIQKKLEQTVTFTGWVQYAKLHENIKDSDIFILPFDNSDTSNLSMPMKIHEYAISRKPIVTAPLPEIKKIYGASVLYASTKDDYVNAIKLLEKDSSLRQRLVNQAYIIAKKYSWKTLANEYQKLMLEN